MTQSNEPPLPALPDDRKRGDSSELEASANVRAGRSPARRGDDSLYSTSYGEAAASAAEVLGPLFDQLRPRTDASRLFAVASRTRRSLARERRLAADDDGFLALVKEGVQLSQQLDAVIGDREFWSQLRNA